MAQVFKLHRLQQIDTHIDKINQRIKDIVTILNDDASLRSAQSELTESQEELQSVRKKLKQAEAEVQAQRIKIEQNQASLYGGKIRNPKELQDLQNEAESLRRHLSTLEDEQLEAMFAVEEAEETQSRSTNKVESLINESNTRNATLHQELETLQKDLVRLSDERQATVSTAPEDELMLYEELRRKRNGVAVAQVVDKTCSACGSTLSSALLYSARSPNSIAFCDLCGRILYAG